jgi:NADH-quinone oxidoreductase subunit H
MCGSGVSTILLLLVAILGGAVGCQREATPSLVQVLELTPHEVETGDRVRITGVGFPEGKTAHVAFHGDLFRPATAPVRGVEIDVDAVVVSGTELEVPLNEAVERLFVGSRDHAAHTTFSGDLTVAFAAGAPAAPPVSGILRDVWLDVRPTTPQDAILEAERAEGERTLKFLGIQPDMASLAAGGVLIHSIEQNSRAQTARLLPGDVITELDGVRVLSTGDLAALPGERVAWLKIRRGGSPHEEVAQVSLVGLAPPPAATLLAPVLVLGLAAILLLLFQAPTPSAVASLEQYAAHRLRFLPSAASLLLDRTTVVWPVVAGVSGMYALFPLAHALGIGDIDVGVLLVLAAASLTILALVTGGGSTGPYSVRAGVVAAARELSLEVPLAAGISAVVATTGSLRLEDLVRAQGGWPWRWTAFASPMALGLFGLWLVAALATFESGGSVLPEAAEAPVSTGKLPARGGSRLFALAARANLFVTCGIVAALFLGGWQIPWLAPEQVEAHLGWTILAAALFLAKAWFLVATVLVARATLPVVRAEHVISITWRRLVPVSIGLLVLTGGWVAWGPGPHATSLVGAVMVALTVAAALHLVVRARGFGADASQAPELDPFI